MEIICRRIHLVRDTAVQLYRLSGVFNLLWSDGSRQKVRVSLRKKVEVRGDAPLYKTLNKNEPTMIG